MRKALMGFILAATVMTPVAAEAQRWQRGDNDRGEQRTRGNNNNNRGEARRQNAPQPQPQQPQQQQQAPQRPQAQRPQPARPAAQPQRRAAPNPGANWNRGGNSNAANRAPARRQSIYPQAWQGNPNDPRLRNYQNLERQNQNRYGRDGRNWRNDRSPQRTERRRNWRNDWNRGWRNDNRYNWNNWRQRNRNAYRLSPYYAPYRGWNYRRFSIGLILQPLFYSQRYWIGDPWQYRLPPAPYGTQWVRYYNDVVLVDIYTGEVVDVIYDFFW